MRNLVAAVLFSVACSSAYADQVAAPSQPGPQIAIDVAPAKIRAPYDVQVVRENGETLPTYAAKDRFYVQGTAGERYTIRISNPTAHRVEAVVSVDGLDAIDGENGDLHKRGYIVPAYGDVRVEGFRTSLSDVATFRFSSVDGSYAGQKGKARNVGVIAVAIFEEEHVAEPQIVNPMPYDYRYDVDDGDGADEASVRARPSKNDGEVAKAKGHTRRSKDVATADKAEKKRAEPPRSMPAPQGAWGGAGGAPMPTRPAPPPRHESVSADDMDGGGEWEAPQQQAPSTNRLGLGTEFGESRFSAASYTRFVRATSRPIAIAELRYNDAAGLMALGIPVEPLPDSGEIMLRETADPFPGDRFARPVR
jgi:hypothetical protein